MIYLESFEKFDQDKLFASGLWVFSRKRGRLLLGKRSDQVTRPGVWGVFGGKIESGERPLESAKRELLEETGWSGDMKIGTLRCYDSDTFKFYNFLALIEDEFIPELDPRECSAYLWADLDNLPTPLHYGVRWILKRDRNTIEKFLQRWGRNPETA